MKYIRSTLYEYTQLKQWICVTCVVVVVAVIVIVIEHNPEIYRGGRCT